MRTLILLVIALAPAAALAQEAGGFSAGPGKEEPRYETRVLTFQPSPVETQTRLFAGTRFWRLDPGSYEVETWARLRHSDEGNEWLFQAEIEIGLTPHIQLDFYENLQKVPGQNLDQEGNQIEMRYSFAKAYGEIWGNPTLYLEWHPRHNAPDRAEVRMLLGGEILPHLIGATNLYVEQNVFDRNGPEGVDGEFGGYVSASYGFLNDHLRLGGEAKVGADQHGGSSYVLAAELGPNVVFTSGHFKATTTFFFGLADKDPKLEPYLILGYGF